MENNKKREKLHIKESIVVEGKDDKSAVLKGIEADVIVTNGFGLNETILKKIEFAYKEKGIIIFTDPDYAGNMIRSKLKEQFPLAKEVFLVKKKALKKGNIGVENAKVQDIIEAFKKVKIQSVYQNKTESVYTKSILYKHGLLGDSKSAERRGFLGDYLGIGYANGSSFLKKLNRYEIPIELFEKGCCDMKEKLEGNRNL